MIVISRVAESTYDWSRYITYCGSSTSPGSSRMRIFRINSREMLSAAGELKGRVCSDKHYTYSNRKLE